MIKANKIKQTQQRKRVKVSPALIMGNILTVEAPHKLYRSFSMRRW